jgi:hypothetical protein
MITRPSPSDRDDIASTVLSSRSRNHLGWFEPLHRSDRGRKPPHQLLHNRCFRALTEHDQSRRRDQRRDDAPRVDQPARVLGALEHPDPGHRRRPGEGRGGSAVKLSRSMCAVKLATGRRPVAPARHANASYGLWVITTWGRKRRVSDATAAASET